MKVAKDQVGLFPYAQSQADKVALTQARFATLSRILQTALKVNKATASSQASAVKAQSAFSKDMTKFLKSSDDLDTLEQQLMAHSQAQASSATTAKTSTDANLKTLTDLSLELKKAQKTFDAGIKAHFKDVSKARREMVKVKKAEKALATQKAKNEKRAKKSEELKTKIDPWLVGRIIDHDYPAILAKENEFQDKVWDLLTDAMALDSKIVSSLEDMAAKNAGKTPTVANKKIDASTSKFGTKNNIRDMALWSRDRVEQVPCGIPTTGQLLTRAPMKQGILNRSSSPSSKAKYGHYVVTPSGILHCFKIKAFAKKKKAGLEADLVHVRLVKEGTKELGFERKLPLYSVPVKNLRLHKIQDTTVEIQWAQKSWLSTKTKTAPITFSSATEMKEWLDFMKLSMFGETTTYSGAAAASTVVVATAATPVETEAKKGAAPTATTTSTETIVKEVKAEDEIAVAPVVAMPVADEEAKEELKKEQDPVAVPVPASPAPTSASASSKKNKKKNKKKAAAVSEVTKDDTLLDVTAASEEAALAI